MNIGNMQRLIAHLETVPEIAFDMDQPCGSVCCIFGHGHILFFGHPMIDEEFWCNAEYKVGEALGLDKADTDRIFYGSWSREAHGRITLPEAIAHLRTLVAAAEAQAEGK